MILTFIFLTISIGLVSVYSRINYQPVNNGIDINIKKVAFKSVSIYNYRIVIFKKRGLL